jgi:hypothetical protein
VQEKQNRLFLFLRLSLHSWQTVQALTLLFFDQNVDLLPQLREQIHLISCFLAIFVASDKPFSTNFGVTHVLPRRTY